MNADANLSFEELERRRLKEAMGAFVTGVTVVTTRHEGVDIGMTCNSFNTVSLDPAMVLWSIRKQSASHFAFVGASGYSVSVLAADQVDAGMQFTRGTHEERFAGLDVERTESGFLRLKQVSAWFDCTLEQVISAGDHDILIGRVLAYDSDYDRTPLVYSRGRFTTAN